MPLGTTGALLLGASLPVAAKGVGNLIQGRKTDYDIYNQEELDKLRRRQEMNALGLTDRERASMQAQMENPILKAGAEAEQARRQLMGSQDAFGGQALLQAGLADVGTMGALQQSRQAIEEADLQKAAAQRQEIEDRMAQEARRQMSRRERRAELLETGAQAASSFMETKGRLVGNIDPALSRAIGTQFGITSPAEQEAFARYYMSNPELQTVFTSSLKK